MHETPVFMRVLQNPCRSKQCGLRVGKVNEIQGISTVFLGFYAYFSYFGRRLAVFAFLAAWNPRQMRPKPILNRLSLQPEKHRLLRLQCRCNRRVQRIHHRRRQLEMANHSGRKVRLQRRTCW